MSPQIKRRSRRCHLRLAAIFDGVLADFNTGYRELVHQLTDFLMPEISPTFPHTWNYDKALGMDPKDISRCWQAIRDSESFWRNLPDLEGSHTFLKNVSRWEAAGHEFYFVTSRVGKFVKHQTEAWLTQYGCLNFPTVLISSKKGLSAAALDLDYYIDDKNENCLDVQRDSPTTKGFMLARAWNQAYPGIPRLEHLDQFTQILQEEL